MRCFISISIPDEIKKGMTAIQERLKKSGADVSWTRPEGMHLTLKFLGEVEENRIKDIETALSISIIGIQPFTLDVAEIGTFPDVRRPRVVWIGLNENGSNLIKLQKNIEKEFERLGFTPEKRGFTPHITLGRIRSRKNIEGLLNLINDEKTIDLDGFEVMNIHLMQSELRPTGAIYTELKSMELKG